MPSHARHLKYLAAPALLLALAGTARADEPDAYVPFANIQIPGAPLTSFDISDVDARNHRYFLADRSNKSLDIIDTRTNSVVGQVGGFVGAVVSPGTTNVNNDISGPNGDVRVGEDEDWVGDGNSTVKVVNLRSMTITDSISTGGTGRADENAWDPDDQVQIIANDADSPPFVTFISTKPGHAILGKIVMSDATNGLEEPLYDRATGLFYEAVPQVGPNETNGAIRVMSPKTFSIVRDIPLTACSPNGLARGPDQQFLAGCAILPASGGPANTQVVNGRSGNLLAKITGVGGSDEVWYNPGNQLYFTGSSNNPAGPVLGIIRAFDNRLIQTIATGPSSHSVAADRTTNHVFVPVTVAAKDPSCPTGCVKVFAPRNEPFENLVDSLIADLEHFH